MARNQKYNRVNAPKVLRHNERLHRNYKNKDIDHDRSCLNRDLINDGRTATERYQDRLGQVYVHPRRNTNTLHEWVITAPKTLDPELYDQFFEEALQFMNNRYGRENLVGCFLHVDEAGTVPHMHTDYIPVVYDEVHQREKVNASAVIDREELLAFHPALGEHLAEHGIDAEVHTGITARQGRNYTIEELKKRHEYQLAHENSQETGFIWDDGVQVYEERSEQQLLSEKKHDAGFTWGEDTQSSGEFSLRDSREGVKHYNNKYELDWGWDER